MRAHVSPLATTCHQVQSLMVFGSAFVLGSTKNCDRTPLARERAPTAAKDHFMLLLTGVLEQAASALIDHAHYDNNLRVQANVAHLLYTVEL